MKTNKWMILLLLVFCRCTNDLTPRKEGLDDEYEPIQYDDRITLSCGECFPIVSDRYEFVVPGTEEEWLKIINAGGDLYTISQLPNDVLTSISTPGLIDALIHAPAFIGFFIHAVDVTQHGWHNHYNFFNSAGEFFRRNDAGNALVAYYKLVNFDCISNEIELQVLPKPVMVLSSSIEYAKLVGLESLFTKQEVLDNMNREKKKEAVDYILKSYKFNNYHSEFRISLMVFIMLADQYEPIVQYVKAHVEEFDCISKGFFKPSDPDVWNIMVSYANNFINDKI